jgi:hypothetical protein
MPMMSPATKMVSIFVSIAAIAAIMNSGTRGEALPDLQHCDKSGWPSCYTVGYNAGQAHPGTSCPSGHSSNFRDGWNDGAGNNKELTMHNSPLIW